MTPRIGKEIFPQSFRLDKLNSNQSERISRSGNTSTMTSTINAVHHTMLFRQAAMLNAHGIECLTANDGEGAYRGFKDALRIVTRMTKEFDIEQAEEEDMTMQEELEVWPFAKTVPDIEESCYYVYNHPLLFAPPTTPSQGNTAHCVAVVIFNMALAFHQRGLPKALNLYEQVVAIVQACSQAARGSASEQETDQAEEVHSLQVIARNNHTQILLATGQLDKANDGLEELRTLLPRLQVQEEEEEYMNSLLFTDTVAVLDELALNTLIPGIKVTAAAA